MASSTPSLYWSWGRRGKTLTFARSCGLPGHPEMGRPSRPPRDRARSGVAPGRGEPIDARTDEMMFSISFADEVGAEAQDRGPEEVSRAAALLTTGDVADEDLDEALAAIGE